MIAMFSPRIRASTAAGCCRSDPERYFAALGDEQNAFDDALAAIRDEQAAGRITVAQAAAEREGLLTAHLARLAAIRARYLGEPG